MKSGPERGLIPVGGGRLSGWEEGTSQRQRGEAHPGVRGGGVPLAET